MIVTCHVHGVYARGIVYWQGTAAVGSTLIWPRFKVKQGQPCNPTLLLLQYGDTLSLCMNISVYNYWDRGLLCTYIS